MRIRWTLLVIAVQAVALTPGRAAAQTFEVVHHFDGTDGSFPEAELIEGDDGALYGTTSFGGDHGDGTIFRLDNGTVTTLHHFDFADENNGSQPVAALIQADDGNFYGTTALGGEFAAGTVFRITPGGTFTVLHDFTVETGWSPSAPLLQADDGDLYGVTGFGGDEACDCGVVFRIDLSGNYEAIHSFVGTDGGRPRAGLVQAADGNLWGTTTQGGDFTDGTIFRITPSGLLATMHHFDRFDEDNGLASEKGALLAANDGNLYGTGAYVVDPGATDAPTGGTSAAMVYRVTLAGGYTVIVSGDLRIDTPLGGLIQASNGFLYGTTRDGDPNIHGTVFRTSTAGGLSILHAFDGTDGSRPHAALVQNADGDLYGTTLVGGDNDFGVIFRIVLPPSGPLYCPNLGVRRDQMAVFLEKIIHGSDHVPPPCAGIFDDVPCPSLFADWVEQLAADGITGGCGTDIYCPLVLVRRDQMAAFLLKTEHGSAHTPPPCTGVFGDVPCPSLFADWVEQLAAEGITGGCGAGIYCPQLAVTRAQMAVFLLKIEHGPAYIPPPCQGVFGDVVCPSLFADWIEQLYAEEITAGCGGV